PVYSPYQQSSISLLFSPFFFHGSGAHRYLHSFPTRRSSDLNISPTNIPKIPVLILFNKLFVNISTNKLQKNGININSCINNQRGDRKSTRLNSSHVSISYAVFCLKKKKKKIKKQEYTINLEK